MQLSEDR